MPYEKVGDQEPVCIADEVPFEIPETWEWVRLPEFVNYVFFFLRNLLYLIDFLLSSFSQLVRKPPVPQAKSIKTLSLIQTEKAVSGT